MDFDALAFNELQCFEVMVETVVLLQVDWMVWNVVYALEYRLGWRLCMFVYSCVVSLIVNSNET